MNIVLLGDFLLYSLLFNYLILLVWAGVFIFAHGWLYKLHGRWFRIDRDVFDGIHYGAMAFYKIGIILLNLVPWLVLRLIG